ncbi:MAG TPA: hypothetical protein VHP61_03650, partial [Acidobacteriota bacterium]|nr:hypothetical protein [Acidobacteriota bacterium]
MKSMKKIGHFRTMLSILSILSPMFGVTYAAPAAAAARQEPRTVAESTNYAATSRYADVMAFIHKLQRLSPLVRVETLCESTEGRA